MQVLNDIYNGTLNTISITGYNSVKSVVIVSSWMLSPVKSLCYIIGGNGADETASNGSSNSSSSYQLKGGMPATVEPRSNHTVITRYDLIDAAERRERERLERKRRRKSRSDN
ncbi:hypothetical protein J7295_01678 [Nakaseomyces glabratus]|nr:hypothetical protein J7298_01671 [Nakaseomyces glabratus]KAH7602163.1 hypothetical protein J7295_01678 [Nakaseomyces glabratus]KAH7613553.1 hypothetical protein J7292_01653 [Nakaseomyces glabratus]